MKRCEWVLVTNLCFVCFVKYCHCLSRCLLRLFLLSSSPPPLLLQLHMNLSPRLLIPFLTNELHHAAAACIPLSMFLVTGNTAFISRDCILTPQESKCRPDRHWVWWEINIKYVRRKIQEFKDIKEVHTNVSDVLSACSYEFRDESSLPIVGSAGATPLRGGWLKTESEW